MAKITFKANGSKALAKIKALEAASKDLTPIFRTIGQTIKRRVDLCFKLGVDPWGMPWKALKWRQGQPLRDTGLLQRSIVARPDATGVTIGTNKIQAPVHQFGAEIFPVKAKRLVFPGPNGNGIVFAKRVKVPARPFLPLRKGSSAIDLPPAWSSSVVRALRAYFKAAIEKG